MTGIGALRRPDLLWGAGRGFTLVELVVVLIIAAILAFLALPRSDNEQLLLVGDAERLASDIRYAQALAMTQGVTQGSRHGVLFTVAAVPVRWQLLNAMPHPVTGTTPPQLRDDVTAVLANLPANLVAFDGRGAPYTDAGATTTLAGTASIALTGGGTTKTVTIQPKTGRVAIQ